MSGGKERRLAGEKDINGFAAGGAKFALTSDGMLLPRRLERLGANQRKRRHSGPAVGEREGVERSGWPGPGAFLQQERDPVGAFRRIALGLSQHFETRIGPANEPG